MNLRALYFESNAYVSMDTPNPVLLNWRLHMNSQQLGLSLVYPNMLQLPLQSVCTQTWVVHKCLLTWSLAPLLVKDVCSHEHLVYVF